MIGPVGLDLSLTATGVATEAGPWVLRPGGRKGVDRLVWLRDQVLDLARPSRLVVVEDVAYSKSAKAHEVGGLAWVVRVALAEAGVPFVLVGTSQLKKYATGVGNAGKAEVLAAAIRRLSYEGHDDNEADALWLRTMALDHYGPTAGLGVVPARQREVLGKIDWPKRPNERRTA